MPLYTKDSTEISVCTLVSHCTDNVLVYNFVIIGLLQLYCSGLNISLFYIAKGFMYWKLFISEASILSLNFKKISLIFVVLRFGVLMLTFLENNCTELMLKNSGNCAGRKIV